MPHETALIATIAVGLALAFLFGLLAVRLRLSPILGYLLAGVAVGPFTPGFVAHAGMASQLAEIGVILLMFGVGLHFSIDDLLAVRRIAIPGAIVQIVVATALGAIVSRMWGWPWVTGLVFGLALSVASTVVLLRALESRGIVDSVVGRLAVGWLIVEDLATVLALVLLPAIAPLLGAPLPAGATAASPSGLAITLGLTLLKVIAFVFVMLVVGRRAVPTLLGRVVRTGSRELFTLAILALALGIAVGAAALFGVSFALGAFFAGVVVSESDFSHEAATNALPLQDAFAVLFFVSVGMLFDPSILVREPLHVLQVVLIILVANPLTAFALVLAFRYPLHTAFTVGAGVAQIGEFSFILAALGVALGLLPAEAQGLIVAGALLSITLNPFVFQGTDALERWVRRRPRLLEALEPRSAASPVESIDGTDRELPRDHVVLIGHGRVGAPVADELAFHHVPYVIIEQSRERAEELRERGLPVLHGDATRSKVLTDANIADARLVIVAAPDAFQARAVLALVRQLSPNVEVIVRTHSDEERAFLESHGAAQALVGERELAVSLTRHALQRFNVEHDMGAVAARTLSPHVPVKGAPANSDPERARS